MPPAITASMLYDLVACPHRVTMDLFGDAVQRDDVSSFVKLLWERGALYEKQLIAELGVPFVDLSKFAGEDKFRCTLDAMDRGLPLIYGGRITAGDLVGEPDLLRGEGGGYIAGDIKSGSGRREPVMKTRASPKGTMPCNSLSTRTSWSSSAARQGATVSSGTFTARKFPTTLRWRTA